MRRCLFPFALRFPLRLPSLALSRDTVIASPAGPLGFDHRRRVRPARDSFPPMSTAVSSSGLDAGQGSLGSFGQARPLSRKHRGSRNPPISILYTKHNKSSFFSPASPAGSQIPGQMPPRTVYMFRNHHKIAIPGLQFSVQSAMRCKPRGEGYAKAKTRKKRAPGRSGPGQESSRSFFQECRGPGRQEEFR